MPVILGILLGLSTLLFIGPVFFYLLKSSLESGFKAGAAVAFGIILGDIICVLLAIFGLHSFFENPENKKWLALIGGILLLYFGFMYLLKPSIQQQKKTALKNKSLLVFFANGFFINFVNPFVFGVWFGFYTLNVSQFSDPKLVALSLTLTLAVIFATDLLKAHFAQKLVSVLKPANLKRLFRVFGVVMIGFAIRLIVLYFTLN